VERPGRSHLTKWTAKLMRSQRRCSGLLLVVAAVALAWPMSWGGQLGFVTTHGISMEPRFHTGDLAVVHPVSEYRVGDITAYNNRMLHTVVLHRIVAIDGGRYTFKGDNNSWLDQERPVRSQLIGVLVLRIPHGGQWLRRLTSPAAIGLAAFALLATGASASRRRRRKGRMSRHAARRRRGSTATPSTPTSTQAAVVAVAICAALAALAWTQPTTRLARISVARTQTMALSYTAAVPPTPAYDGTTVTAPTPVFRNVTNTVTLRLGYHGQPGRLAVDAELSTEGGWTSTVALARPRDVPTGTYTLTMPLNLAAVDRRAQAAGRVTGLPATPVTVTVVPVVTDRTGQTFAPRFPLTLTPLTFTAPADVGRLTMTKATPATKLRPVASTLKLSRFRISVRTARLLTAGLLAVALLVVTAMAAAARLRGAGSESEKIRRRWRELLFDVEPMPVPAGRPVVDVPAFASLVRLARRYELLVLHWARAGVHTYVVQDDATVFRYRTSSVTMRTTAVPGSPPEATTASGVAEPPLAPSGRADV